MSQKKGRIDRPTAETFVSRGQIVLASFVAFVVIVGLVLSAHTTLLCMMTACLAFYAAFVGSKVLYHCASVRYSYADTPIPRTNDPNLPIYTLLVPLYKEANMLPSLSQSIKRLNYPPELVQVLLLLEEDDSITRAAAESCDLPQWTEVVTIPDGLPKGKPRALNVGLARARGEYCVIYDAEDRPDPQQLLKAVGMFRTVDNKVACIQARLHFWNEDSSWVTRFYWAEYVVHFEWVLTGLTKLGLVPPLGGTSNHFRTEVLKSIQIPQEDLPPLDVPSIGGWDPWNVTEDAELAGALRRNGYRVLMFDSVTAEEATATLKTARRQRQRWLKGYLQTGLVYTRHPFRGMREMGPLSWLGFNLLMLGTPLSLILNPIFWVLTVVYFATRSQAIESLFPPPLFYTGVTLLVIGNLLLLYQLIAACMHRGGYGSVRYMLLTPFWWAFTSYAAYHMLWELARPSTRHVWHKTEHGHDLSKEIPLENV